MGVLSPLELVWCLSGRDTIIRPLPNQSEWLSASLLSAIMSTLGFFDMPGSYSWRQRTLHKMQTAAAHDDLDNGTKMVDWSSKSADALLLATNDLVGSFAAFTAAFTGLTMDAKTWNTMTPGHIVSRGSDAAVFFTMAVSCRHLCCMKLPGLLSFAVILGFTA